MTPGFWGSLSAVSWGTADFLARFTGRAAGYVNALLAVLLISLVFLGLWAAVSGAAFVWSLSTFLLLILAGLSFLVGYLFFYRALVWGPVTLVAPIAGSYPAMVVLIAVILGSRPSALQWTGTFLTLVGVVVVARGGGGADPGHATASVGPPPSRRRTAAASVAAAVAFAAVISITQEVVPVVGTLQTLWVPRAVALVVLAAVLAVGWARGRPRPAIPRRWWPVLTIQAGLDTGGYLALYLASSGPNPEIAAMASSAYYVVTVLLGRVILKEHVSLPQVGGIGLVFAGVLLLSA